MFKRLATLALASTLLLPLAACNAKDAVLVGLYSLQGAATSDGQAGEISQGEEAKILTFTTQAEVAIQLSAKGWQASVKSLWTSFKGDLSAADQTKYATVIATLDVAINAL